MATDPRFLTESGREVFTGNELLVKGCLETEGGVHLLTGYRLGYSLLSLRTGKVDAQPGVGPG